jgi:HD superfamily phosphohydrolase
MFTQVYYHKTRRAYDFHIAQALKSALAGQELPSPEAISEFLQYDDWWFLGALQREEAGEHGNASKTERTTACCTKPQKFPPTSK